MRPPPIRLTELPAPVLPKAAERGEYAGLDPARGESYSIESQVSSPSRRFVGDGPDDAVSLPVPETAAHEDHPALRVQRFGEWCQNCPVFGYVIRASPGTTGNRLTPLRWLATIVPAADQISYSLGSADGRGRAPDTLPVEIRIARAYSQRTGNSLFGLTNASLLWIGLRRHPAREHLQLILEDRLALESVLGAREEDLSGVLMSGVNFERASVTSTSPGQIHCSALGLRPLYLSWLRLDADSDLRITPFALTDIALAGNYSADREDLSSRQRRIEREVQRREAGAAQRRVAAERRARARAQNPGHDWTACGGFRPAFWEES